MRRTTHSRPGRCPTHHKQKAEALASRASTGNDAFVAGQKLYERGRYSESVLAFEEGVRLAGFDTQLGGEVRGAAAGCLVHCPPRSAGLTPRSPACMADCPAALQQVSLWLALAYDASGKREACLELYKRLESTHHNKARPAW